MQLTFKTYIMRRKCLMLFLTLICLTTTSFGQKDFKNIENFNGRVTIPLKYGSKHPGKRMDEAMNRWRAHGLGQFIHWGVYAIPGGYWEGEHYGSAAEWIRVWKNIPNEAYDKLYQEFNPTKFDAKKWAKQAKDMGAKYMIFTTKHHDGFCLWPSKYSDYTIANSPYKKDIVKEVVDAYTAEGIDVILYFSVMDWNQGGWKYPVPTTEKDKKEWEEFKQFTRNQLLELVNNYPSITGLWFDGTWDNAWVNEAEFALDLENELKEISPDLIIGSRFRADEFGNRQYDANGDLIGDYDQTWERDIPVSIDQLCGNDWDCAMTIPENGWGYDATWSSYVKKPAELIEMISQCASMGGNFVLNFGPDGLGNIRSEETHIAAEIGKWMKTNGEAIYGSEPVTDIVKQDWGYMTRKDDNLYLHVYKMPFSKVLKIEFNRKTYVPGEIEVLTSGEVFTIEDAGRNKQNSRLFNLLVPSNFKPDAPFVIKMNLIDNSGDKDAYHQAKT